MRVEHARFAGAAADEDRVRARAGRRSAAGARAFDHLKPGHAERCGVAARCARRARACASIATARSEASASIHSIATDPAPAPMSHSSSPRRGASADSVERAHLALGDLAVVLEQIVGKPARARDDARAWLGRDLDRHRVERIDRAQIEIRGGRARGCVRAGRPALPAR